MKTNEKFVIFINDEPYYYASEEARDLAFDNALEKYRKELEQNKNIENKDGLLINIDTYENHPHNTEWFELEYKETSCFGCSGENDFYKYEKGTEELHYNIPDLYVKRRA